MSNPQTIICYSLIIVAFFFVWTQIVLDNFYGIGDMLVAISMRHSAEVTFAIGLCLPFLLLLFVLYVKSPYAYGFTLFIFAIMIFIPIGNIPVNLEFYYLDIPPHTSYIPPPMGNIQNCLRTLGLSVAGFALMNFKELPKRHNWNLKKSRWVLVVALVMYLVYWAMDF